jgi:tetratricopeptide (TPR) repeat protein
MNTLLRTITDFPLKRFAAAVSCAVLLLCVVFYSGRFFGAFLYSEIRDISLVNTMPRENLLSAVDTLGRASFFDPFEPEYHYERARVEAFSSNAPAALREFRRTVALAPANSVYLQGLGLYLRRSGDLKNAGVLLRSGVVRDRRNPDAYKRYGALLIEQGMKAEGTDMLKTGALLEPSKTRDNITVMVLAGLTDEEIRSALPQQAGAYTIFADYLDKIGKNEMASDTYDLALSYAVNEKPRSAGSFHSAHNFYIRKQLFTRAVAVMEKALEFFPRDPAIRLRLAQAYEKEDLKAKALEQYRVVLEIDPKNTGARKKIEELR